MADVLSKLWNQLHWAVLQYDTLTSSVSHSGKIQMVHDLPPQTRTMNIKSLMADTPRSGISSPYQHFGFMNFAVKACQSSDRYGGKGHPLPVRSWSSGADASGLPTTNICLFGSPAPDMIPYTPIETTPKTQDTDVGNRWSGRIIQFR